MDLFSLARSLIYCLGNVLIAVRALPLLLFILSRSVGRRDVLPTTTSTPPDNLSTENTKHNNLETKTI